jgi:hypothetical protein
MNLAPTFTLALRRVDRSLAPRHETTNKEEKQAVIVTFEPSLIQILTLISSFGIPVFVGLVTQKTTNAGIKATLLAGLSLVAGVLGEAIAAATSGATFDIFASIYSFAGVFIVAVASHYGFWKPTGVSAAVQSVGAKHAA